MPTMPLSYLFNYLLIGYAGVSCTYLFMQSTFPLRRSPALWYLYFTCKMFVDAHLWYALSGAEAEVWVEPFQNAWLSVLGVASLLVMYQSFESDLLSVAVCGVISDLFAGICTSLGTALSNMICGFPLDIAYLNPFGTHTVVTFLTILGVCMCIRIPVSWMLRWMCRMVRRNAVVWGIAATFIIVFCISMTQKASSYLSLAFQWPFLLLLAGIVVAVNAVTLFARMREMRSREQVVRTCAELTSSYDQTIQAQLTALECDLAVLEGHERVLGALTSQDESDDVAERTHALEKAYQNLSGGTYCNRPALDAVLTAGAHRLKALGVRPTFTVAVPSAQKSVPATVALALLNLAGEAAERVDGVQGEVVEMRVRGVGDQVVFRLAVPGRWGTLWARRFLSAFDTRGTGLVRERKQGDRRVVIVVSEGAAS